ncbi:MAG: cell division protein FtsQ/DivIB [Gallionella sp.]|jgi:cell division protein FtsQ|nr:cell division protein FtsQ/DivIB [Gallionella sp.]MCK9354815.1 cell division protein FtsQ/DivIB [Gallionella sp.]
MWDNAPLLRNIASALMTFSVLAVLYGAAYYTVHLPGLFPLHSVRLDAPPQRVIPEEVLQKVRGEVNGNFFTVDIDSLRASLEQLPWVRSVNIRREFPDRLTVQLEEHQILARWNGASLVNTHGEVFDAQSAEVLPSFVGQDGDSYEISQRYGEFGEQLEPLRLRVAQIALSPRHAWQLHLSNGMVLELGREEMEQRLARFVEVYPYSLAALEGSVKYVDLRYRNGFALGGAFNG